MRPKSSSESEYKKLPFVDRYSIMTKTKVKYTRHPKLVNKGRARDLYDMSAFPFRGWCLIFANYMYKCLPPLKGYFRDADILERVFQELGFKVIVFKNLSGLDILKNIKEYTNGLPRSEDDKVGDILDGSKPNAFVSVILSHGNSNEIHGVKHNPDGKEDVIQMDQITRLLNNKNCLLLKDRPKILFVQACRGTKEDDGVPNTSRFAAPTEIEKTPQTSMDSCYSSLAKSAVGETSRLVAQNKTSVLILQSDKSPTSTDILVCYSTLDGYRSYVFDNGSVFGLALAENLIKFAHNTELMRIISKVSKTVCEEEIEIEAKTRAQRKFQKQVVNVHQTGWHNQLFFNPGYPKSKSSINIPTESVTNGNLTLPKVNHTEEIAIDGGKQKRKMAWKPRNNKLITDFYSPAVKGDSNVENPTLKRRSEEVQEFVEPKLPRLGNGTLPDQSVRYMRKKRCDFSCIDSVVQSLKSGVHKKLLSKSTDQEQSKLVLSPATN